MVSTGRIRGPRNRMRRRGLVRGLSTCLLAAWTLGGCQAKYDEGGKHLGPAGPTNGSELEDPPSPDPATCVCAPVAPFGYDGPSIVGRADELAQIHCPADASLPGFAGLVLSTGQWARECRVTPLPTCRASGWVCVPPPPLGFALCIYRSELWGCPADYHLVEPVLEADGADLSNDKAVTLCCADEGEAG